MDDTLEFLTKIYGELTEFRKEAKADIQELKNDVIQLENKLDNNLKALFDGYHQDIRKAGGY